MKYDGGVVIAADTLGSYGSMARFPDLQRILKVGKVLCSKLCATCYDARWTPTLCWVLVGIMQTTSSCLRSSSRSRLMRSARMMGSTSSPRFEWHHDSLVFPAVRPRAKPLDLVTGSFGVFSGFPLRLTPEASFFSVLRSQAQVS